MATAKKTVLSGVLMVFVGVVCAAVPARAFHTPPNGYFGLGGGFNVVEEDPVSLEEEAPAVKGFIGLQPSHYFAVELGFTDLGSLEGTVGGVVTRQSLEGPYLQTVGVYPITSGLDVFGKVGAFRWDQAVTQSGTTLQDEDGFDPVYGAGFSYLFVEDDDVASMEAIALEMRVEWEHYMVEPENADQVEYDVGTLNLVWHFI